MSGKSGLVGSLCRTTLQTLPTGQPLLTPCQTAAVAAIGIPVAAALSLKVKKCPERHDDCRRRSVLRAAIALYTPVTVLACGIEKDARPFFRWRGQVGSIDHRGNKASQMVPAEKAGWPLVNGMAQGERVVDGIFGSRSSAWGSDVHVILCAGFSRLFIF